MSAALILYGSRARGDARHDSDVDLILAEDGEKLKPPQSNRGVSVHLYSKGWLEAQARAGSLFTYHVAHEGVALHDEERFLQHLAGAFRKSTTYRPVIEAAALILRLMLEKDWRDNFEARRRYFWALRTIVISTAADRDKFIFAPSALETEAALPGLQQHIQSRGTAQYADCLYYGEKVLGSVDRLPAWTGEELRSHLLALGGVAYDSVRVIEEHEAVEGQALAIYL